MKGIEWKREEEIGSGCFGIVYKARATTTTTTNHSCVSFLMAIKSASISNSYSLQVEFETLSSIPASPYIIGYYGEEPSVERNPSQKTQYLYNLFLEYASHGSLENRIRHSSSGLPESLVKSYTRSIAKGLNHIHNNGFVHCDIKPDNILLASASSVDGKLIIQPKIADFGLAKRVGAKVQCRGTPYYMAPESIRLNECEPDCDVWAMGCVVLEMLTGRRAWELDVDEPVSSLLDRIAYSEELPAIPNTLSAQAKDFLRKCLVKNPALRWKIDMLLKHPFVSEEKISLKAGLDKVLSSSPKHPFDLPCIC